MPKRVPSVLKTARTRAAERRSGGPGGGFAPGTSFLPAPVLSGVAVTPDTALACTAVFAAINVISTDAASLPLLVLRRSKGGGRAPATSDPRFDLLRWEPNDDATSFGFRQALFGHALSWGNGYARIDRTGGGDPYALRLLSPRPVDTWAARARDGRKVYYTDGGRCLLLAEDVVHVHGLGYDGESGYSPIAMARQAVGLAIAAEQYGSAFFGNGSTPKGYLKKPGKLTPEAKRNLRESWESIHQGTQNSNRVAVLDDGLEWCGITIPPDDAQFLATRQFQVEEVARMYRLPPHKLSDYRHSHLANVEEANLDYLNTTLGPWLEGLEQELNRKLFTPRERAFGLHVNHDTSSLLRGNAAARTAIFSKMSEHGALSPDEWRDREGLNPIPDDAGQVYFAPLNMKPLWSAAGDADFATEADPEAEADPGTEPADAAGDAGGGDDAS